MAVGVVDHADVGRGLRGAGCISLRARIDSSQANLQALFGRSATVLAANCRPDDCRVDTFSAAHGTADHRRAGRRLCQHGRRRSIQQ